ncbi:MAG: hypothetical protein AB7I36_20980 [Rhodospirillaceae bacterium]
MMDFLNSVVSAIADASPILFGVVSLLGAALSMLITRKYARQTAVFEKQLKGTVRMQGELRAEHRRGGELSTEIARAQHELAEALREQERAEAALKQAFERIKALDKEQTFTVVAPQGLRESKVSSIVEILANSTNATVSTSHAEPSTDDSN